MNNLIAARPGAKVSGGVANDIRARWKAGARL